MMARNEAVLIASCKVDAAPTDASSRPRTGINRYGHDRRARAHRSSSAGDLIVSIAPLLSGHGRRTEELRRTRPPG